jgi:hypothetical protein
VIEFSRDMLIAVVGGCVGALACEFATVIFVGVVLAQSRRRKEKQHDKE